MNTGAMKDSDRFSDVKKVAVIGGTIDCAGNLSEEIRICTVVQVGENDVMVTEEGFSRGSIPAIVPKSLCVPLHASYETLIEAKKAEAELGDLVFYSGKLNWKDKESSQIAGILCEIRYRLGTRSIGRVLINNEMQEVDYNNLLVLQKKA